MNELRAQMFRGAATLWLCMSAGLVVVGVLGPWETGRRDIWRPGPHVTTSGWEEDAWMLLVAVGVAAAALVAHGRLSGRWGAWVFAVLALLAGGFMILVTVAWFSSTPITCDAFLGPVCEAGEDAIVTGRWGAYVALAASVSLTAAVITILLQRREHAGVPTR